MRTAADNERIWEGLESNTIQVMATDHCPFFYDGTTPITYEDQPIAIPGKELGQGNFTKIPNGLPGVGDRMPVLWTQGVVSGRLTPNQFVALHCTNPARIFGLYPQKGALIPGADADIAIWDPNKELRYGVNVAQHRTDYNLYEGWQLKGFPVMVFLRGQKIVDGENWSGKPGMGKFLHRHEGEIRR
jgi:dihydropyrimidinase